jgi:hypothetical protein
VALVLFFLSAVAAMLSNAPFNYQAVEVDRIRLEDDYARNHRGAPRRPSRMSHLRVWTPLSRRSRRTGSRAGRSRWRCPARLSPWAASQQRSGSSSKTPVSLTRLSAGDNRGRTACPDRLVGLVDHRHPSRGARGPAHSRRAGRCAVRETKLRYVRVRLAGVGGYRCCRPPSSRRIVRSRDRRCARCTLNG